MVCTIARLLTCFACVWQQEKGSVTEKGVERKVVLRRSDAHSQSPTGQVASSVRTPSQFLVLDLMCLLRSFVGVCGTWSSQALTVPFDITSHLRHAQHRQPGQLTYH